MGSSAGLGCEFKVTLGNLVSLSTYSSGVPSTAFPFPHKKMQRKKKTHETQSPLLTKDMLDIESLWRQPLLTALNGLEFVAILLP